MTHSISESVLDLNIALAFLISSHLLGHYTDKHIIQLQMQIIKYAVQYVMIHKICGRYNCGIH